MPATSDSVSWNELRRLKLAVFRVYLAGLFKVRNKAKPSNQNRYPGLSSQR